MAAGGARIPDNFAPTAPAYDPSNPAMQRGRMPTEMLRNPQTVALLDMLGLPYNLDRGGPAGMAGGAADIAGALWVWRFSMLLNLPACSMAGCLVIAENVISCPVYLLLLLTLGALSVEGVLCVQVRPSSAL